MTLDGFYTDARTAIQNAFLGKRVRMTDCAHSLRSHCIPNLDVGAGRCPRTPRKEALPQSAPCRARSTIGAKCELRAFEAVGIDGQPRLRRRYIPDHDRPVFRRW